jgi:hypothetical protein
VSAVRLDIAKSRPVLHEDVVLGPGLRKHIDFAWSIAPA